MIWGIRHLAARRLAFRNDYCRTCKTAVRAVRTRTFWFVSVVLIPVVPLGIRRRWLCSECGFSVEAAPAWGGARKITLAAILALAAVGGGIQAFENPDDDLVGTLVVMGILVVGAILLAISAFGHRKDPSRTTSLRDVPPTDDTRCPYCNVNLTSEGTRTYCLACNVERHETPRQGLDDS